MIIVSKEQWDLIDNRAKDIWGQHCKDHPEWVGRKTVIGKYISDNPDDIDAVLVEGVHFIIMNTKNFI